MNSKCRAALLLALWVVWPTGEPRAQFMTHEWVLTAGAGLSDPTGTFEEQQKLGPHATLSLGRHFNPSWLLGLRAGYYVFDSEPAWILQSGQTKAGFWVAEIDTRLMLYPESWFTPYLELGAGAGLETQFYADSTGEHTVNMGRPGVSGGVGISMHRERRPLSFYTELIYQHFPTHNGSRQWLRWTTGLRFSVGGRPF